LETFADFLDLRDLGQRLLDRLLVVGQRAAARDLDVFFATVRRQQRLVFARFLLFLARGFGFLFLGNAHLRFLGGALLGREHGLGALHHLALLVHLVGRLPRALRREGRAHIGLAVLADAFDDGLALRGEWRQ